MRRRANRLIFVLTSLWLAANATIARADEVNLYSTREAPLIEPVIASFAAATGIKVKLTYVEDNLVKHMKAEGDASHADVLMTIGLDKTSQFVTNGLTQTISSSLLDKATPPQLRGAQWIALSVRPRVVMARADAALGAIHYEDLAEPQWRGKLCIRSPLHQNNVALIAAYLVHHGEGPTEAWLNGLKANLAHKPTGKDNDVIREIAQGTCEIGIGNTVALAQLRAGREGSDWSGWARAVKAVPTVFRGGNTHVNLTGAAIAKHAPHPAAAQRFLEFLVTPAAQRIYAAAELEYPVLATADRDPILVEIGSFPADALPIDQIAAHQQAAIAMIKKVGFEE